MIKFNAIFSLENSPNAMGIGRQTVSLPLSAKLTNEDVKDVIEAVKSVLK